MTSFPATSIVRAASGDVRRDARDRAALHRDVEDPVESAGRVEGAAAFQQEVVHVEASNHAQPPVLCPRIMSAATGLRVSLDLSKVDQDNLRSSIRRWCRTSSTCTSLPPVARHRAVS